MTAETRALIRAAHRRGRRRTRLLTATALPMTIAAMMLTSQGAAFASADSSALACTWDAKVCAQVNASSPSSINWFKGWFQNGLTPMDRPRLVVDLIDANGNVFMHAEQAWDAKSGGEIRRDVNQSLPLNMSRVCTTLFSVAGRTTACAELKR